MFEEKILVYHFIGADGRTVHGDLPVVVGETMAHPGDVILCKSGFHGGVKLLDALHYAQGPVLCQSELWGGLEHADNKSVGRYRKCLWQRDITRELHEFALWCAEEALALVDNPDPRSLAALEAKRKWLAGEISDWKLKLARDAARDAAGAAAEEAIWEAGWGAAREAVEAAARAAAREAARGAAGDAAEEAIWEAARVAAMAAAKAACEAACEAAEEAIWEAVRIAARAAVREAAWEAAGAVEAAVWKAARAAIREATWAAARERQERKLMEIVGLEENAHVGNA